MFARAGVDFVQEKFLGQGPQDNESAIEQAKDEQISDFIRDKCKYRRSTFTPEVMTGLTLVKQTSRPLVATFRSRINKPRHPYLIVECDDVLGARWTECWT